MEHAIESLIRAFERGTLSRRDLVKHVAALAAVAAAGPAYGQATPDASPPVFDVRAINHLALRTPDVARSRDWYRQTLGMRVTRDNAPSSCFLTFEHGFLALFRGDQAGLDHFCFSIPDYDADAVTKTLEDGGFAPRRSGDRVYFDDPDGLEVQLAGLTHQA